MKPFEYAAPKSLDAALELLSDRWGESEVMAGGTDLVTCLKQGIVSPKRVVSLRHLSALRGIEGGRREMRIGALTTLGELAAHADVRKHFPALVTAVQNVASAQLLSVGTVGGDLCQRPRCWYFRNGLGLLAQQDGKSLVRDGDNRFHAVFGTGGSALFVSASSLGPPLIALRASFTLTGPGKKRRTVSAAEFFRAPASESDRETVLQPREILTEITIPVRGLKNASYEVRHRSGLDWPYASASVAFQMANGVASDVLVVLGQVAAVPWTAAAAAAALQGQAVNETTVRKVAEAALQGAIPLSGNGYKVPMAKTAVRRALWAAAA
jgi:xanthine dehydrogenase YagS FAD-binding subunit